MITYSKILVKKPIVKLRKTTHTRIFYSMFSYNFKLQVKLLLIFLVISKSYDKRIHSN